MFGNLKNKIGEVTDLKKYSTPQNLANSLMGSRQRSGTHTPSIPVSASLPLIPDPQAAAVLAGTNQASDNGQPLQNSSHTINHSRSASHSNSHSSGGSVISLPNISHSPLSSASSRSHSRQPSITSPPLSPGLSPTPPADAVENGGSATPTPTLIPSSPSKREEALSREVEKLRAALEQQQDAHLARLAAKDSEWKDKFSRHADKVSQSQEALQKSDITIASLRKELDASNDRNKELMDRLQHVQEDCDELEGLSVQEAAKIKHMLLNTSTELEAARGQLRQRASQQAALEQQLQRSQADSEQQAQQLQQKVQQLQQEVHELEQCRQQTLRSSIDDSSNNSNNDSRLQELQQQHADREQSLLTKVEEWRSRCDQQTAALVAEQQQRQEEQRSLADQLQQAREALDTERGQHSAALTALQAQQEAALAAQQDRANKDREKWAAKLVEEKERSRRELLEQKGWQEEQVGLVREECDRTEQQLMKEIAQLKAEKEEVRWKHADNTQKDQQIIKDLQLQLDSALARCSEAQQQAESARAAQLAATARCEDLQSMLQELQDRTHAQVVAEKANSERLQAALASERAEKQSLEASKAELEAKLQVYSSEKSKLSQHLDEYAARVSSLEQRSQQEVLQTAQLKEDLEQLQQQAMQYKQKLSGYESGALETQQLERSSRLDELQLTVTRLEEELADKKQALKVQGQRMADMKKTMQRELRISPDTADHRAPQSPQPARHAPSNHVAPADATSSAPAVLPLGGGGGHHGGMEVPAITKDGPVDPINLEYLKHVVLKFITSREYEALHLTKAMSTLLHLSRDEERLLQDTLSWRMSWFGAKPQLVPDKR